MRTAFHAGILVILVTASTGRVTGQSRPADTPFPRAKPGDVGLPPEALLKIEQQAAAAKSDAVIVIKDGKLVCEKYLSRNPQPIEAMSATKSIVGLAIGFLVDDGAITSIDQPVCEIYPEWKQGRKRNITIRHLLTHSSGLQSNPTTEEIYASPNFVQLALAAEVTTEPGEKFLYNNKAINLIPGIVQKLTGKPIDAFLRERLFEPLDIREFSWTRDKAGNPHGMSGLQIHAIDLAKIGQLMLDDGMWKGKRILSESWVRQSIAPQADANDLSSQYQTHGLLWWLYPRSAKLIVNDQLLEGWRKAGAAEDFLRDAAKLRGTYGGMQDLMPAVAKAFGDPEKYDPAREGDPGIARYMTEVQKLKLQEYTVELGPIAAFAAQGYLGQYLVVAPEQRIVAVRQRRYPMDEKELEDSKLGFREFIGMIRDLGASK